MLTVIAPSPDSKHIYRINSFVRGEVHRAVAVYRVPSGKGVNAVRALCSIAAAVRLVTPADTDFKKALQKDDTIRSAFIDIHLVEKPIRCCTTLLEDDATATEIVQEANSFSPNEAASFYSLSLEAVEKASAILLMGSLPPGVGKALYELCARRAQQRGIPVVVDAHGSALCAALSGTVDVVKITRAELASTLQGDSAASDMGAACASLRAMGARTVVLTDGDKPVIVAEKDDTIWTAQPESVTAVNPIGSGDAMSAGIALALSKGWPVRSAVRFGMRMGSANAATLFPGDLGDTALCMDE